MFDELVPIFIVKVSSSKLHNASPRPNYIPVLGIQRELVANDLLLNLYNTDTLLL